LTAPLAVVGTGGALGLGCDALAPGSLAGRIALISRGVCNFSVKIRNAQAAGALAVLIVNNRAGDPVAPGKDDSPDQPTIPAYMVAIDAGPALIALNGLPVTIASALAYVVTPNGDIMAGFSGQGPTDVDFRVKPDVVAPGVNVLSSIRLAECGGNPC